MTNSDFFRVWRPIGAWLRLLVIAACGPSVTESETSGAEDVEVSDTAASVADAGGADVSPTDLPSKNRTDYNGGLGLDNGG